MAFDEPAVKQLGRPTDYDPSYCERVVEWGALGKSKMWMAATLGVHRDTINHWEHIHPAFSDAMKRAKALEQMWWEDAGQDGMVGDKFNSGVWVRSMAARFPDDWRETSRRENTGPDGGPQQLNVTSDAIATITGKLARLALPAPAERDAEGAERR